VAEALCQKVVDGVGDVASRTVGGVDGLDAVEVEGEGNVVGSELLVSALLRPL